MHSGEPHPLHQDAASAAVRILHERGREEGGKNEECFMGDKGTINAVSLNVDALFFLFLVIVVVRVEFYCLKEQ